MQITSVQNSRIKTAAKLRNSRDRSQQGRIIIDGIREIHRAMEGGVELLELFVSEDAVNSPAVQNLKRQLASGNSEQFEVTPTVFDKLAYGNRGEGVVAVAKPPKKSLSDLRLIFSDPSTPPLIAVLERLEKPGNVGAVLRSADAAGVTAVVVADAEVDLYNPNAIRASLGTIFTLPVVAASSEATMAWLRQNTLTVYAARVDAVMPYTACDLRRPCAIVLGSESHGLSQRWLGDEITPLHLPMLGAADSLNVSATAAVLFYEALRQRTSASSR